MLRISTAQALVVTAVVLVGVLLFIAPQKSAQEKAAVGQPEVNALIDSAIALVNGASPMQGILLLREVLENNPENVRAHFELGVFSIQSGQFQKAIDRFDRVIELDSNQVEVYLYRGRAFASLNDTANALLDFEKFKQTRSDDPQSVEIVDRWINALKTN